MWGECGGWEGEEYKGEERKERGGARGRERGGRGQRGGGEGSKEEEREERGKEEGWRGGRRREEDKMVMRGEEGEGEWKRSLVCHMLGGEVLRGKWKTYKLMVFSLC